VNALLRAAVAALVAVGCSKAESAGNAKQPGGPGGGATPPPMPVEVAVAASDTVVDAINASGQIEAVQSIELRPDIEGRLSEILVREGVPAARGTPLFKVDDAELRAEVARAAPASCSLSARRPRPISSAPKRPHGALRRSSSCCGCGSHGRQCARRSPVWSASAS
jgi:hypothetical protein